MRIMTLIIAIVTIMIQRRSWASHCEAQHSPMREALFFPLLQVR